MESHVKKAIIFLQFFSYSLMTAQFNTLTRSSLAKKKNYEPQEEILNVEMKKQLGNERIEPKIKLFKTTSKEDLRKEVESLKTLLIKYSLSKIIKQQSDFQNREDSLRQVLKINAVNLNSTSRSDERRSSVTESYNNARHKIFMPLAKSVKVTSPFGVRYHPIYKTVKMHNGADLKANYEEVHSVLDGRVTAAGWDSGGGGNFIKIRHSDSFITSYLHLSEIYYKVGETVKAGYIIGKSGNSGNSTGAHLHFSVSERGNYINPIRFLNNLIKTNNSIVTYYANK